MLGRLLQALESMVPALQALKVLTSASRVTPIWNLPL